jgi:hypothetical protein
MNTSWVDKLYHKQDLWMKKSGYSFISYVKDSVVFALTPYNATCFAEKQQIPIL